MENRTSKNVTRRAFVGSASSVLGAVTLGAVGGIGLAGCTLSKEQGASVSKSNLMLPGQYTAGAKGYWGIIDLPVTITVTEDSIIDISLPEDRFEHGETEVILRSVKDRLIPRIIKNQSIDVDAVSGATMSSFAVKEAVDKALREAILAAGNNEDEVSRFHVDVEKEEAGQTEEISTDILFAGLGYSGLFAMKRAIEYIREINGGRPVNVVGMDRAGKIGGKSCLAHEFHSINPMGFAGLVNNGEPFVDASLYREVWREYTTTKSGEQSAKDEVVDLFFEESGNALDWLYFENDWRFGTPSARPAFDGLLAFNQVYTDRKDPGTMEDRRGAVDKFIHSMAQRSQAQGARILLETEVYDLIFDGNQCTGALARDLATGKEYIVKAKAVVMNTGGYALNDELMNTLPDEQYAGSYKVLTTGQDTGLVFKAALDAGAGTWNCNMPPLVMNVSLPYKLTRYPIVPKPGTLNKSTGRESTTTLNDVPMALGCSGDALDVNRKGRRFCDESQVKTFAGDPVSSGWQSYAAGPYYFAIWSQPQIEEIKEVGFTRVRSWQKYNTQGDLHEGPLPEIEEIIDYAVDDGLMWKAPTLEELASQIDIDPAELKKTYDSYNSYVSNGVDPDFRKDEKYLMPIGEGPYYAVKVMTVPYASGGGLDIDRKLRVLKNDHATPFEGLYALGCDSYGVLMNHEKNYNSYGGVAQGWVLASGYVGGYNAAEYVNNSFGFTPVSEALSEIPTSDVSV